MSSQSENPPSTGRPEATASMLDESQVIDIARAFAENKGWTFRESVRARLRRRNMILRFFLPDRPKWYITSNAHAKGNNVYVTVDALTGTVLWANYIPR